MPHYHTSHLRNGRFSEPGRIYAITAVTHCRKALFHDFFVGRLLIDELRLAEAQDLATSLCWVVMPDHFHWLFQLGQCDLEKLLRQVKSRSAKASTNACSGAVGSGNPATTTGLYAERMTYVISLGISSPTLCGPVW